MRVQKNQPSATRLVLQITVSGQELLSIKQRVVKSQATGVTVPGFRAGHAPLDLVEKRLDPIKLQTEVVQEAVSHFYSQILRQDDIRPVTEPEISMRRFVPYNELEFEVGIDVFGKLHMPEIKKLNVPKEQVVVTAKDVNEVVHSLQCRQAKNKEMKRAAKKNDEVVIDFQGKNSDGKLLKGAEGKDYPLQLGSKTFIPGFEEAIIGMKSGDTKSFDVRFPKDYRVGHLRSQKVHFEIKLKKVHEVELPELDDDFAVAAGPFANLSELKEDIKKQLSLERQLEVQQKYEQELLEEVAKALVVEIPPKLVDEQSEQLEKDERARLVQQGVTWQEHLSSEAVTEQEHHQRQRRHAEQAIKISLVLSEVVESQKIDITDDEIETRLTLLRGQYNDPAMQNELNKPENRRQIAWRLRNEKALQALVKLHSS